MLWSSAEFATWEPGSCFQVKARVCVHVRVRFPHVTDMGQPLTAVETHPYRRVFSKRIFSKLQITFAALVMWNHLAVGTFGLGFFFFCIGHFKEALRRCYSLCLLLAVLTMADGEEERQHWLTSAAAARWALSTSSTPLLRRGCDSRVEEQPSAACGNWQDVSVFIYPLHS